LEPKQSSTRIIKILALIEAVSVTGPAKNLIGFARRARPEIDLTVVLYRRASAPDAGLLPALQEAGIPVRIIDEAGMGDPRVMARLKALFRTERPDVIQTHNTKSHFFLRLMGSGRGAPWVAFHHGFTDRNRKDRLYNAVAKWALGGADRVVTVCEAFAHDLRAAGVPGARISLRHNFVLPFSPPAVAEVESLRERLGIPADARVLLSVGRLSREKGHADLLEALALARLPGLRLVIAGDGPERPNLERQLAALGLQGTVVLAGHQPDVRPFYALADAVALPSHSEGSPNVLLEAMSAGLPIVATDAGGIVEIASDGETALIVPAGKPAAFAAALQRVWADPELACRLGAQGRVAARRFAPEAYVEAMGNVYREVLKKA
jgi:glycosyltransferase involved in cell wall biosynthesis